MAALMDSYQPKGITFSQHHPETSRSFDDQELDEGDIVKSKPRGKMNSYFPLMNDEVPHTEDPRERLDSRDSDSRPHHTDADLRRSPVETAQKPDQQSKKESIPPPNGQIPVAEPISTQCKPMLVTRSVGIGGDQRGADQSTVGAAVGGEGDEDDLPQSEIASDKGLEDSTTALLRRYTMEKNGRPTSIHLGPSGEIVGSSWLSEILMTGHKKCSVTLEEDCIRWRFLSRKEGVCFIEVELMNSPYKEGEGLIIFS